jgi:hypothetical protein
LGDVVWALTDADGQILVVWGGVRPVDKFMVLETWGKSARVD